MENADPPIVSFKKGFHDARGDKAIGKVSRYKASDNLVQLLREYTQITDKYLSFPSFYEHDLTRDAAGAGDDQPEPRLSPRQFTRHLLT